MIASITTTHRGAASPKGGRIYAVVTLATTGLKVRADRAWNQEDSPMDNHRRAIIAALDDAALPREAYTLDGFRDFWGNGHWAANRNANA